MQSRDERTVRTLNPRRRQQCLGLALVRPYGARILELSAKSVIRSRAACLIPSCRATFGVLGANVPALIRGLIAVARYGIQTYLASTAFVIIVLKFWPSLAPYADVHRHGFVGLSALGWAGFMVL